MTSVHDYLPGLRKYALYLTRNADRADDLVQDTCLAALTRGRTYDGIRDPQKWALSVMHNTFIDTRRREAVRSRPIPFEDRVKARQEDYVAVREAVELLDSTLDGEEVILAAFGYTNPEMRARTGRTKDAIKQRQYKARKNLRRLFDLP